MRQQVNLLSEGLIPPKATVTAVHVLVSCAAFAGLLMLWSAWLGYGLYDERKQLAVLSTEARTIAATNEELRLLAQRLPERSLAQRVALLRERKREDQRLRTVLVDLEDTQGFTRYFSELAQVQVNGLWLDGMVFGQANNEVTIRGQAHSASKIPEFLQRLAKGNGFRGHTFDQFELTEADEGNVRFEIIGPGNGVEQGG